MSFQVNLKPRPLINGVFWLVRFPFISSWSEAESERLKVTHMIGSFLHCFIYLFFFHLITLMTEWPLALTLQRLHAHCAVVSKADFATGGSGSGVNLFVPLTDTWIRSSLKRLHPGPGVPVTQTLLLFFFFFLKFCAFFSRMFCQNDCDFPSMAWLVIGLLLCI